MRFITTVKDFLRNIKYGIENFWKYKTLIWNDRDWDWYFLYQVQGFKLREMANLYRVYGTCSNSEDLALEMEEAADCLQRLCADDYSEDYEECIDLARKDLIKFYRIFEAKSKGWWD